MIPASLKGQLGADPGGVFFLHGSDHFRKRAALDALVDAHLDPSTREFNLDVVGAEGTDVETLASMTATPPMMAEWRVVVIRDVQALAGAPRARKVLLELAEAPPEGLAVILEGTVPARSKARFYKDLKRVARSAAFEELSANDVPGWLMAWARDTHGVTVDEDAARALAAALGTDLGILAREVEKLALRVEEGGTVTLDVVREAGTRLPRQDRWQWMDRVGERRFREALEGLPVLLGHGESAVGLVVGLTTHFLRLGVALEGGKSGLEGALPPNQKWLASRLAQQARNWSGEELERALLDLRQVDRLLKSSPRPPADVMEEWLLRQWSREGGDGDPAGATGPTPSRSSPRTA